MASRKRKRETDGEYIPTLDEKDEAGEDNSDETQGPSKRRKTSHSDSDREEEARPIACKEATCFKRFTRNSNMTRHYNTAHLKRRRFVCLEPECGKTFGEKHHLKSHLNTHLSVEDRPHHCTNCFHRFGDKSNLTRHVKSKTACFKRKPKRVKVPSLPPPLPVELPALPLPMETPKPRQQTPLEELAAFASEAQPF